LAWTNQLEETYPLAKAVDAAELREHEAAQAASRRAEGSIPEAPFKTTWPALVMKRVIRFAADHGFERVAWTTGTEQEERYWGHEALQPAVRRWSELTEPKSVRELSDKLFGSELGAALPLDVVDGGVLSALKYDQVRKAVIALLPVDVVDILRSRNLTPDSDFQRSECGGGEPSRRCSSQGGCRPRCGAARSRRSPSSKTSRYLGEQGRHRSSSHIASKPDRHARRWLALYRPAPSFMAASGPAPEGRTATGPRAEIGPSSWPHRNSVPQNSQTF
jgi:hypothetical protein